MEQLIEMYGTPTALRVDNGSELTAAAFGEWCVSRGIDLRFIQPGKPDQNAYIERFNRSYRTEVLDAYVPSASRFPLSMTFNVLNARPPYSASTMK